MNTSETWKEFITGNRFTDVMLIFLTAFIFILSFMGLIFSFNFFLTDHPYDSSLRRALNLGALVLIGIRFVVSLSLIRKRSKYERNLYSKKISMYFAPSILLTVFSIMWWLPSHSDYSIAYFSLATTVFFVVPIIRVGVLILWLKNNEKKIIDADELGSDVDEF